MHLNILSLCLFATQNQQGNPCLNTSSLEVHAEKIEVQAGTAVLPCDKKQNIPFWKILIKHQQKKRITKQQAYHVEHTRKSTKNSILEYIVGLTQY